MPKHGEMTAFLLLELLRHGLIGNVSGLRFSFKKERSLYTTTFLSRVVFSEVNKHLV